MIMVGSTEKINPKMTRGIGGRTERKQDARGGSVRAHSKVLTQKEENLEQENCREKKVRKPPWKRGHDR